MTKEELLIKDQLIDVFKYNDKAPAAMDPCQTKYYIKYSQIYNDEIHKMYYKDKMI